MLDRREGPERRERPILPPLGASAISFLHTDKMLDFPVDQSDSGCTQSRCRWKQRAAPPRCWPGLWVVGAAQRRSLTRRPPMPRKPELTDLQLILLSTAFAREDGHLYPLAVSIADKGDHLTTAIASLLKRKLVEQAEVSDIAKLWMEQEDGHTGLVLTDKARALIDGRGEGDVHGVTPPRSVPCTGSKREMVLTLLGREEGAAAAELIDATGWLPHTMRAALTGLRKKGHVIERGRRGDLNVYRVIIGA